jgi:hypothetical protein
MHEGSTYENFEQLHALEFKAKEWIFTGRIRGYFSSLHLFVTVPNYFLMALQPLWSLATFQSPDLFIIGRTPWTSDQLVTRPLPKYRRA